MVSVPRSIAVLLFVTAILWPFALVVAEGWTLTGLFEEPIGYRYFYSLRALYDDPVYLFLPQGQFSNLIHRGVQIVLTAWGEPITQILPRIDDFALLSVAVFLALTIVAFVTLAFRLSAQQAILAALFWAAPFYVDSFAGPLNMGYTRFGLLVHCDYMALWAGIAMLSAAMFLQFQDDRDWTVYRSTLLGLLASAAVTIKLTLVLYPFAIFALAVDRRKIRTVRQCATIAGIAGTATALVLLADYNFRIEFVIRGIRDSLLFMRAADGTPARELSGWDWLLTQVTSSSAEFAAAYLIVPIAVLAGIVLWRRGLRLTALSVILGSLFSEAFIYARDYSVTLLEVGFFAQFVVFLVIVQKPRVFATTTIALLVMVAFDKGGDTVRVLKSLRDNTKQQHALHEITSAIPGRLLWLVPTNTVRPNSINSSLMKGGSNSYGVWVARDSRLLKLIAERYDFRFNNDMLPIRWGLYSAVLFVFLNDMETTRRSLSETYRFDIPNSDCRSVPFEFNTVAICRLR